MTKDQALDLAQEALEEACEIVGAAWTWRDEKGRPAITAIKQARSAPVQEPVAHLWKHSQTGRTRVVMPGGIITADASWFVVGPLILGSTTPPAAQRQWVGLTDESVISAAARVLSDRVAASCNVDCGDMWMLHGNDSIEDARAMLEAAEAKLKENT
jgi:hypothetical protein